MTDDPKARTTSPAGAKQRPQRPADSGEGQPAQSGAETDRSNVRPTVDQLSEWSFPASDPPPAWTWEVPAAPLDRNVGSGDD